MTRAHRDLRRQAAAGAGYRTANNMEYGTNNTNNAMAATAAALEGLAEATQSDRAAVANLTTANSALTDQIRTINELKTMMKDLVMEVKTIKNTMKTLQQNHKSTNNKTSENNETRVVKRVQNKWCWSCGVNRGHDSTNCRYQAPGHQTTATIDNMMGSNPFGMHHK